VVRKPERCHGTLLRIVPVFEQVPTAFIGKVSPVHLFRGALDLAVTRFSGRLAPLHPAGIPNLPEDVAQEACSHQVSSAGFWPGGGGVNEAMFYSYAYPAPNVFADQPVLAAQARYDETLGEFLLPYAAVRASDEPAAMLMAFLQSTYAAAAKTGDWDRAALERAPGRPRVPRPLDSD